MKVVVGVAATDQLMPSLRDAITIVRGELPAGDELSLRIDDVPADPGIGWRVRIIDSGRVRSTLLRPADRSVEGIAQALRELIRSAARRSQ